MNDNDYKPNGGSGDDEQAWLREELDEVGGDFPLPASGNDLIMLEIDPHRAHVCWNIDPADARPFHPLVLRVYDITSGGDKEHAEQVFDVEVFGLQGRWYLDLWRDDRTFVSEIGYRNADGSFKSLATSNPVQTPSTEPASEPPETRHVDPNGQPLHTDWPGDRVAEPAVAPPAPVEPPPVPEPVPAEPIRILDPEFPVANWPVLPVEDDVTPPAAAAASNAPAAIAPPDTPETVRAAGEAAVVFDDEVMSGGAEAFPSAEALQSAVQENRDAIQAFYAATELAPAPESAPSAMGGHTGEPPAPASHAPTPPTPAPLEQIVGLSSLEHPGKDVLLEVNAELHIYGRAKPDTELTLYGQVVRTRPDGSFSVRRPLPHGAVVVPLLYARPHERHAD